MFKTQFSSNHKESFEKISSLGSKTIPDQSLTITQVLNRYSAGTLGNISKSSMYDYDETTSMASDDMDNISPFRRQNYDLADYTTDSISNRHSLMVNKAHKSSLEKQILVEKLKLDEAKKGKEDTPPVD